MDAEPRETDNEPQTSEKPADRPEPQPADREPPAPPRPRRPREWGFLAVALPL